MKLRQLDGVLDRDIPAQFYPIGQESRNAKTA